MIPLTLAEVAAATGGRLSGADPHAVVAGPVVVDSRQVAPGSLFVAVPGERVDGHDFAAAAVEAGAIAVLAGRDPGTSPSGPSRAGQAQSGPSRASALPCVLVDDPQAALGALARAVVDRLPDLVVVAVTGSSGKTGTKDLLAALLADVGPTVAPPNSFNNEVGVPLTALRADAGTRFLVSEMGARRPGNITYLCGITPPRIGVVLNVGSAHAGVFGSREATAATKGELPAAVTASGVAVLNADDPLVAAMAARTVARVVRTGRGPDADVRAVDVRLDGAARARFRLVTRAGEADVALGLHGEHHVANALAAAAVGLEAGLAPARIAELLAAPAASRWRMDVRERADGVTVVNDAYNANPDSVLAALRALAAIAGPGRRSWAALGEMLELGPDAEAEHEAVGRAAARLGIDRVVAVGAGAAGIAAGAGDAAVQAADLDAAVALLEAELRPGDVVLVKASRAVGLDVLAERLLTVPGVVGA